MPLLPCRRQYPAGVDYPLSQSVIAYAVFTTFYRLDHRCFGFYEACSAFTHVQPSNSLISLTLTLSVGFSTSITLHAATQAIRLRRSGTSLKQMRGTLWITTAIHLDTQKVKPDPATQTFIKPPRRNRVNAITIRVIVVVGAFNW